MGQREIDDEAGRNEQAESSDLDGNPLGRCKVRREQPCQQPRAEPTTRRGWHALKAILPIGGGLLRRSSQSLARSLRRSQAQNFSTGLRSGEDTGTCHARTPAAAMARLLAAVCKTASLSQRTVYGRARRTADRDCMAFAKLPRVASRHHSAEVSLRVW